MKLERAKGTRDYLPEENILRQKVIGSLRSIFELYGYSPLETPILERLDVLSAKYAGGSEILKETFRLKDQGERDLALRYDLTVPLCRFVGMNPNLKMPFKRYQMGIVFRDGPIKLGRLREFWQCDIDVVGSSSMNTDAELITIAQKFFEKQGMDVLIEVNNRKLLNGIMDSLGITKDKMVDIILAIDKLKKTDIKEIEKELKQKGLDAKKTDELLKTLKASGTNKEKAEKLRKLIKSEEGKQGLKEIEEVLGNVDNKNIEFSLSLARGLAYYTGTVFEVFLKDRKITSSLAAGGRYDKMIAEYLGSRREYPAVGISFGIEPMTEAIRMNDGQKIMTVTRLFIIPIGTIPESLKLAEELREAGINTDIDLQGKGPSKNLNYANYYRIPYVLFVGEEELKQKKYKLKDMNSGKEEMLSVSEIKERLG